MGRPRKGSDDVRIQLNAMVVPDTYREVEAIAISEHRTRSAVAEMLLERGLAAFRRDGSLLETSTNRTVKAFFVEPREKPPAKAKAK